MTVKPALRENGGGPWCAGVAEWKPAEERRSWGGGHYVSLSLSPLFLSLSLSLVTLSFPPSCVLLLLPPSLLLIEPSGKTTVDTQDTQLRQPEYSYSCVHRRNRQERWRLPSVESIPSSRSILLVCINELFSFTDGAWAEQVK